MLKNYFLVLLSGLILALAWPTYGFSLMIFVGWIPLFIVEYNVRNFKYSKSTVFFLSLLTFLVWNIITTWWIWNATAFGSIFAIVVNSLLMSIIFLLYHIIAKRKNQNISLIFFITTWISFEKFHHNWDFSWPWLSLGNVFSENIQWIQWYEYTGIFGGTLWILLVNVIFFKSWMKWKEKEETKWVLNNLLLGLGLVVFGMFSSKLMFENYQEKGKEITAVVLQPNTNPYTEKYHQSHEQIVNELVTLSTPQMNNSVEFVLAPETVLSNRSSMMEFKQSPAFSHLTSFVNTYPNAAILTGFDQIEIFPNSTPKSTTGNKFRNTDEAWYESYNSALFLTNKQNPEVYHKMKLVVGVEHFPFRKVLEPILGSAMIDLGGSISTLTPEKEVKIFENPNSNTKVAPIICYESIYGEHVGKYVNKGAEFLGIITNDSWWGNTQGHKQLLSYARLRAIENRRAIARSANSGISSFINQKGEIISSLPYETQGALKGKIFLNTKKTFYTKYGDFVARISFLLSFLLLISTLFYRRRS